MSDRADLEQANQDRPRLVAIATRVLGDGQEAEDVVQEVMVRLSRLDRAPRSLPAWLTTATYRSAIDALRKRGRRPQPRAELPDGAGGPSPREQAELRDEGARAFQAVASLGEPYTQALRLRFGEGLGFSEIAQRMSAPERTVRTWVGRGLVRLRARLGGDA